MLTKDNFKKKYPKYLKELENIRSEKYPQGVSKEHIAAKLGMSVFSVYKWQHSDKAPKLPILNELNRFKEEVSK